MVTAASSSRQPCSTSNELPLFCKTSQAFAVAFGTRQVAITIGFIAFDSDAIIGVETLVEVSQLKRELTATMDSPETVAFFKKILLFMLFIVSVFRRQTAKTVPRVCNLNARWEVRRAF